MLYSKVSLFPLLEQELAVDYNEFARQGYFELLHQSSRKFSLPIPCIADNSKIYDNNFGLLRYDNKFKL